MFAMHQKKRRKEKGQGNVQVQREERSPIHRPSIVGEEFLTNCLESIIVPQIMDAHRSPSQRIDTRLLDILGDAQAIETNPGRCNNRIMHDLKCDAVNEIVRNNLEANPNVNNQPHRQPSSRHTLSFTSPLEATRNTSLRFLTLVSASSRSAFWSSPNPISPISPRSKRPCSSASARVTSASMSASIEPRVSFSWRTRAVSRAAQICCFARSTVRDRFPDWAFFAARLCSYAPDATSCASCGRLSSRSAWARWW